MLRQPAETTPPVAAPSHHPRQGLTYAVLAYGWWGLMPLYIKLLSAVAPQEVLAQRIFWCFALLTVVIALAGRWRDVRDALTSRSTMLMLTTSTLLLTFNWYVYIYSVDTNQVVEASLGYFLLPLVNVLLGVVILHERLRRWQTFGVFLAAIGVLVLGVPWIAVSLAVSFAVYGLLRKQVAADGLLGLFVETLLIAPLALAYIVYLQARGASDFTVADPALCLLLAGSGVVTCVPLLLFAAAARRLRLATLGILQYLSPTMQFLIAVFWFGEQLTTTKLVALCFIWAAVVIYALESVRALARQRSLASAPLPVDA
jgi:chloramphenicol-sensitive protein RarD